MIVKKKYSKLALLCLTLVFAVNSIGLSFAANILQAEESAKSYNITNPYEKVNWNTYAQYKADFHAHYTNSDGANTTAQMVEDHYAKGYDILAMTDHNYTTEGWDKVAIGPLSSERKAEIEAGVGRRGIGMIDINNTNEQSATDHINTFWSPFNNVTGDTMATILLKAEEIGGISHINHAGRYTGGANSSDDVSIAASNNAETIKKYVDLFKAYPTCVGMEIINKIDNESKSERILWDNILKEMMPTGRFVFGFSNDDTHSLDATGYSWNVMLMPRLSQAETRIAMENGAFYAVSRVSRLDGINRFLPTGAQMPGSGNSSTLYLLLQPTPSISNIEVRGNTIAITGADYDLIEWIADGKVIATGSTIDLRDYADNVNSYVRAQLKSNTGIAFTQPFGVSEIEPNNHSVSFSVARGNGSLVTTVDNVDIASNTLVQEGKSVVFMANPNFGFKVKEWKLNDSVITGHTADTFTLTNLSSATKVTVEFEGGTLNDLVNEFGCNAGLGYMGALIMLLALAISRRIQ